MEADQNSENQKLRRSNQFIRYTGLGFQWLFTFGLFGIGGYYLDGWLGTLPLFLVLFLIIALVGNIYLVIKSSKE